MTIFFMYLAGDSAGQEEVCPSGNLTQHKSTTQAVIVHQIGAVLTVTLLHTSTLASGELDITRVVRTVG
eukprot:COSAG05_NODE_11911_length_490_cov_1.757033_2_plen_69_part_00